MPSEFAPGGSKPRMTKAQIRKLQKEQKEARRIAEEKLAKAKKSEEWKKEQEELNTLENILEDDKLISTVETEKKSKKEIEKKLSFIEKIILWIKKVFN